MLYINRLKNYNNYFIKKSWYLIFKFHYFVKFFEELGIARTNKIKNTKWDK